MVSPFVLLKTGVFTVLVPGTAAGLILDCWPDTIEKLRCSILGLHV